MAGVHVEHPSDGVALVTMDDPDRRNAMTEQMGRDLATALAELGDDPALRCVVLTGTPPAFSAGGDLAMLEDLGRRAREEGFDATATMRAFYDRFLTVRDVPVPVVAAINGHAVGAGLCVALACDLRIVATDAKVGLNFARLGLHPGMGGSWLLPRTLPQQQAARWLYTGALVSGHEAAAAGMALEALPADQVLSAALELAEEVAANAPLVVRQLKVTLAASEHSDLPRQLDLEAAMQAVNYRTADLAEGVAAGRERRPPSFRGD